MDYKEKADELAHWCTGGCISIHPDAIPSWTLAFEKALTEAFAAGLAEGEAKLRTQLAELQERAINCDRLYDAIKTWMPAGFKSHCVDAMHIMDGRVKEAEAKFSALTAEFAAEKKRTNDLEMKLINALAEGR